MRVLYSHYPRFLSQLIFLILIEYVSLGTCTTYQIMYIFVVAALFDLLGYATVYIELLFIYLSAVIAHTSKSV